MFEITPIFVLLIIFGFIYGIVYIAIRKKERMEMLAKGVDPAIFNLEKPNITTIRYGLLLIGVAIGILLGNILEATSCLDEEVSYFSMIFLWGGMALVISHFVEKYQRKK
ncbi:MAG: hypothetical protein HQ565_12660 [Bacteroidetes bacterium]|nr:hypothetical protein [Bacteroidota bacterium]